MKTIDRTSLDLILEALRQRGYSLVGPTMRDGAIVYDDITSTADLPKGWTDEQQPGSYRLRRGEPESLFGYVVGPHAWKKFLHPPVLRLWRAQRRNGAFELLVDQEEVPRHAFIGVRACELQAIALQDQVFLQGTFCDPAYQARRERVFIVAVNCTRPGGTCFCASMNTGPKVHQGFDLALTEVQDGGRHYFLVESGSDKGAEVLAEVPHVEATDEERARGEQLVAEAARHMGRTLELEGVKDLLYRNSENPRWDEVAARCLSCGNCTMVCPTCFCTTVEDVTDLTGNQAERWRKWDSCFTLDFSYIHGGSIRPSIKARYRQWLTHKLATWYDQFGSAGCVGCGRCLTWCPVGIDITEEVRVIRESESAHQATTLA